MKIAVIGAGIVGMSTAYELLRDGHEVIVFERHASVAQEASFACGGHASPSLSHPFAFPEATSAPWLSKMVRASGISMKRGTSLRDVCWLYRWKMGDSAAQTLATAHGLLTYSAERLRAIALQESFTFERSQGHLLLWRSEAEMGRLTRQFDALKECGISTQTLTPDQARAIEPALQSDYAFHGASYFASDEVGNCRQLAHLLKAALTEGGADIRFGTSVTRVAQAPHITVHTAQGHAEPVDHVVICAAGGTATLGLESKPLPLTTLWSYTLSAPIREPLNAPRSAVQDMQSRTSVSRLGMRVRVSGAAELGVRGQKNAPAAVKKLYRTLNTLFPGAADFSKAAQIWKGASQFTRDGLPLVGPLAKPGMWLNVGHGHNGWGMAFGCARLLADMVGGKPTDLDATKLQLGRFHT